MQSQSQYIPKPGATILQSTGMPYPKDLPSPKWYQNISTLPLERFIRCICDGNLGGLVISGASNPEQLAAIQQQLEGAWSTIMEQYTQALGDHEYTLYISLFKEVSILEIDMDLVQKSVDFLKIMYHEKMAAELIALVEAPFILDPADVEQYILNLDNCIARAKIFALRHQMKAQQLMAIQKRYENGGNEKPTREYFQSVLITLSDHAKYHINERITVFQYCERIKRLNKYISTLNN